MSDQKPRQPKGQPTGGQFTAARRPDATTQLFGQLSEDEIAKLLASEAWIQDHEARHA